MSKRSSSVVCWSEGPPCLLVDDGQQVFIHDGCLRGQAGRQAFDLSRPR